MHTSKTKVRGLYAITPCDWPAQRLLTVTEQILLGGARVLQFRDKQGRWEERLALAQRLRELTHRFGTTLIINDDFQMAVQVGADGVHMGREDGDLAAARKLLGPERLLGASCYDSLELATAAHDAGADHIAFGSVFASPTKPQAVRAPLALFAQAAHLGLPRVAIGGINAANAVLAAAAGADAVAMISALYDAPDPQAVARAISQLFTP
jgi:thiamine-phosphate pyrophosphorylase